MYGCMYVHNVRIIQNIKIFFNINRRLFSLSHCQFQTYNSARKDNFPTLENPFSILYTHILCLPQGSRKKSISTSGQATKASPTPLSLVVIGTFLVFSFQSFKKSCFCLTPGLKPFPPPSQCTGPQWRNFFFLFAASLPSK